MILVIFIPSAPGAVPGILVVPLIGRLPDAGDARLQVLAITSSTTSSMPRPGLSGTVMKPSLTSGLGRPVTMSSHQSTSTEWYSSAMKFSVATATCAAAIAAIGLSAMWMAMATPWSCAASPIFLVSRMPPVVSRSGWMTETPPLLSSGSKPSLR